MSRGQALRACTRLSALSRGEALRACTRPRAAGARAKRGISARSRPFRRAERRWREPDPEQANATNRSANAHAPLENGPAAVLSDERDLQSVRSRRDARHDEPET